MIFRTLISSKYWALGCALALSLSGASLGQQPNLPLPGLVVRDSAGTLVGQVVSVEPFINSLQFYVLISQGPEKVLLKLRPAALLAAAPANEVFYSGADCTGSPRLSFDTGQIEHALRGVVYGIGIDEVIYRADDSSPACGDSTVSSKNGGFPGGSFCEGFTPAPLPFCKEVEATSIDLTTLEPPFRIE